MDRACSFTAEITERDVRAFAGLTGDRNPLHLDAGYARTTEFGRPIAHGALLIGLVSRVLGMHLPGQRSLILAMKVQFPKPLYYPATVTVEGRVQSVHEERGTGVVSVVITDTAKLWPVLEAEVAFALHHVGDAPEARPAAPAAAPAPARAAGRRRLLVTGGTGGIGSALVRSLSASYEVHCLTRRGLESENGLRYAQVDLEAADALERYLDATSPEGWYGVLHLSAPPMPRAFVSDDLAMVRRHLRHGIEVPLLLAQWARRPGSGVKRLVLLGSTAGLKFPKSQWGAYSLGKAALEYLPRLLTADLAAQGATVNVITPTAIPVGMNEGMPERARAALAGRMPTRRLLDVPDVAALVRYVLSDEAAQINGAAIAVDGGLTE